MRLMIRTIGLGYILAVVCLIIMYIFELNIYEDELIKISSLAMSSTQIVVQENIEDIHYGTNNARKKISDELTYINEYKNNMNKLISTNASYDIKDYYADASKGLLYVDVTSTFNTILGNKKVIHKQLLNIIDVVNL